MIRKGDIVTVRTSVTGRTTYAEVYYVNYRNGWFTGIIEAIKGKYRESFWIDDIKNIPKTASGKRKLGSLIEDDPDAWLSKWDEKEAEEADAFARRLSKR